jgi:hypothetical protein
MSAGGVTAATPTTVLSLRLLYTGIVKKRMYALLLSQFLSPGLEKQNIYSRQKRFILLKKKKKTIVRQLVAQWLK